MKTVFDLFDNIYVSFSGGKDSGVLLNLCIDYIRQHGLQRRIGVFHMDYEIQYRDTLDYVNRTLAANADILDVYRVCIPFKVQTCTSMFQQYWRPWDGSMRDIWVREMPEGSLTQHDFPFFTDEMWDYEFQNRFAEWLHRRSGAKRTCCLRRSEKLLKISKVSYAWKTYRKHFSRSLDFVEIIPRPRLEPL